MNKPFRQWKTEGSTRVRRPMLTAEDELALIRAWQDRQDVEARNRLVDAFAPLAATVARRFTPGRAEADPDLLQQANIGLLKAADRFDPERGMRFSTYAIWWVRAEIQDYRLATWSIVRRANSAQFRKAFFNLDRMDEALTRQGETDAAERDEKLAQALGLSRERLADLRIQIAGADSSLNESSFDDGGEDRISQLSDPETEEDDARILPFDTGTLRTALVEAMADLPERERDIVLSTQLADPPATLEVLGERYGISKERVRQLRERAFERLRSGLGARKLSMESFV